MTPETLRKLAALLPERVRVIDSADIHINMPDIIAPDATPRWRLAFYLEDGRLEADDSCAYMWLECALREEIEARGWNWEVSKTGKNPDGSWQRWGHIWHPCRTAPEVIRHAPTPAEALALALIAALEAEG